MRLENQRGAITVLLSLISVLFLSLICTLAESARVQGCRARAAAILDMGLFSVFGEYEKRLLEDYDVFFLDGAYGSGDYHLEKVRLRLEDFMSYNENPQKGLTISGFEPLNVQVSQSNISGVTLATDQEAAPFYQQAVSYMKQNVGAELAGKLLDASAESKNQEEAQKSYEENEKQIEQELVELEEEKKRQDQERELQEQERKEQDSQGQGGKEQEKQKQQEQGEQVHEQEQGGVAATPKENPLDVIKKIKEMGILGLVVKEIDSISSKELSWKDLPSNRTLREGNLKIEEKNSGIMADALFQEYSLESFPNMLSKGGKAAKGVLDYQLEYMLMGNSSDKENLKGVVNRLLLLREGSNFLYAMSNQQMRSEALALATVLVGAFPVPGLITVTQIALLLGWAYGESLLDVRKLLSGGNIPLQKSAGTWKLSLENLARLTEVLQSEENSDKEGLSYQEYLRLLLFAGKKAAYPMRALDMIEGNLKQNEATKDFRADACISRLEVTAEVQIPPLFMNVSGAYLGVEGSMYRVQMKGSFAY